MPTVLANALLSFVPDKSVPVRGPDRVAVVSPMFDEEAGAGPALDSLFKQTEAVDELVVSVNGGSDDTAGVVRATLTANGYRRVYDAPAPDFPGRLERWHREAGPTVVVLLHAQPISKADSINAVVAGGYLTSERVLVVDGDTIFAPTFVARLKDSFYSLRRERHAGGRRYVIEDSALQSGSVMSLRPPAGVGATHISLARSGEYAVATLLRQGQTARLGAGRTFGQSRLYTVVGCGFVARRSSFPMPADTLTEDHDFTLQVQNERSSEQRVAVAELQARGFEVRTPAGFVAVANYFDVQDEVVLRRSANARFVPAALMYTEDPLNVPGYMRQVERWNGGGVENAFKRLRTDTRRNVKPNVAFAVFSAQFENLFGLALLLLLLPVALGVNSALPGYGTALRGLGVWLGVDLLVTLVMLLLGFRRVWRGQGQRGWRLLRNSVGSALGSAVPLLSMRLFNAVAYVAAFTRALPKALRPPEQDPRVTITWERPRAVKRDQVGLRVGTVTLGLLVSAAALFLVTAYVADAVRPGYKDTWMLINKGTPVLTEEHVALPLHTVAKPVLPPALIGGVEPLGGKGVPPANSTPPGGDAPAGNDEPAGQVEPAAALGADDESVETAGAGEVGSTGTPEAAQWYLSDYCSVPFTASPAHDRRLLAGDAGAYQPLTYWERLMLARLVPLAAHLEEAATAYDVPARLLLQVLINESFLDPLAVGPTEDLGLSQVTGEALTLLRNISNQPGSRFANPVMFAAPFSVFDPDFSICAGAAKLAWSRAQPQGHDDHFAYARYINPLEGVQRSGLNPLHAELVVALDGLADTVDRLRNAFAAYLENEEVLTEHERALFDVYGAVAAGDLSLGEAYLATRGVVASIGIDDVEFYDEVTFKLYGFGNSTAAVPGAD